MFLTKPPIALLCALLSLWGCSTAGPHDEASPGYSPHPPFAAAEQELTEQRFTEQLFTDQLFTDQEQTQRVEAVLQQVVGLPEVSELLLINSPQVRVELTELGIAQAQALQAELISNPTFAVGALRPEGGGRWQLDAGLSQSLLDLFTRPLRAQLAQQELVAAQLTLHQRLTVQLQMAQQLYFSALAARQLQHLAHQQLKTAEANVGLAESLFKAGNIAEAALLEARLSFLSHQRASQQTNATAQQAENQLAALLGLNDSGRIRLADALPPLPESNNFVAATLLQTALSQRSDLQLAREQILSAEHNVMLQHKTGAFTEIDLGVGAERETDGRFKFGPDVSFSLPLFDRGHARKALADAAKSTAVARYRALEFNAGSDIKTILIAVQSARQRAEQISTVELPLQRQLQQLRLREYNFMLTSPFQLLTLKQQEFELQKEYTNALLAYWQARSRLAIASGTLSIFDAATQANTDAPTNDHNQPTDHSMHHHGGHHHD